MKVFIPEQNISDTTARALLNEFTRILLNHGEWEKIKPILEKYGIEYIEK